MSVRIAAISRHLQDGYGVDARAVAQRHEPEVNLQLLLLVCEHARSQNSVPPPNSCPCTAKICEVCFGGEW